MTRNKSVRLKNEFDKGNVDVEIQAGISEAEHKYGGWYIFCNDRLILGPEQTSITGWSGREKAGESPKYHGWYKEFRGYVFFNAEQSDLLPWTTTKNNVDLDSEIFRSVRSQMVGLMRPVIDFLNHRYEARKKIPEDELLPIDEEVNQTEAVAISNLRSESYSFSFISPKIETQSPKNKEKLVKIIYDAKQNEVEKIKKISGAKTFREVGELTFE